MEQFFKYLQTRDAFVSSLTTSVLALLGHPVIIALLKVANFAAPLYVFRGQIKTMIDLLLYSGLGSICLAIFSISLCLASRGRKK